MSFKKAVKEQAKLRLALCGLAGTGKTFSALAIAAALAKLIRESGGPGRIAVIDSERGSASLYANKFDFDVCELDSFSPLEYVAKIQEAEAAGYDIIVPDSISHAWMGKDGALDQKDKAAERSSSGNSWTAWRTVTPKHNALVDALVGSKAHVIATMRQKMEHVQDVVNGRTEIKKVGLAAIQREGMEFEFTLVGDLDHTHTLKITKTRIDGIDLDQQFEKPGEAFARRLYAWLMDGEKPTPKEAKTDPLVSSLDASFAAYLAAMEAAADLKLLDEVAAGPSKPVKGTREHEIATRAYLARKTKLQNGASA
jgi:hypothetical protein